MSVRRGDIISSIFFLVLAAYIYISSLELEPGGPEKMPQLVAVIMGIFSLLLLIKVLRSKDTGMKIFEGISWSALAALLGVWLITMLLIEDVGFFFLLGVFMAAVKWSMSGFPREHRELVKVAAYAVVTTAGFWLIFVKLKNIIC